MEKKPPDRSTSFRDVWKEARYERATKGRPLTGSYTAPGAAPGGSPVSLAIAGVVLAVIVGGLMLLAGLGLLAVGIGVAACLGVGLYLAREQSWVNEESERRQDENEDSR